MAAFEYEAISAEGKEVQGVVEADTPRYARQMLRSQQLIPVDVRVVTRQSTSSRRGSGLVLGRIKVLEVAVFYRQLAVMLGAGLPLGKVLYTISQQMENRRMQSVVASLNSRVNEGHSLARGMSEFPGAFSDLDQATVEAGEQSGHLAAVLARLADFAEARHATGQQVQAALLYPVLLTIISLLILGGLLTYVVPQVVSVFDRLDQTLPLLTRLLIASSDFLRSQWPWLILVLTVAVAAFLFARRIPSIRFELDRLSLNLPLVGRLRKKLNGGRFTRTFGILNASGVPVLEAMRISANVIVPAPMKLALQEAALSVREGASIEQALGRSGYFSPVTLQLINAGEAGGRLDEMLERSADSLESEANGLIRSLLSLLEPMLILFMGGAVLVIVLGVLLPIFELNQLAG